MFVCLPKAAILAQMVDEGIPEFCRRAEDLWPTFALCHDIAGWPTLSTAKTLMTVAPPFRPGLAEGGGVSNAAATLVSLPFFPAAQR